MIKYLGDAITFGIRLTSIISGIVRLWLIWVSGMNFRLVIDIAIGMQSIQYPYQQSDRKPDIVIGMDLHESI